MDAKEVKEGNLAKDLAKEDKEALHPPRPLNLVGLLVGLQGPVGFNGQGSRAHGLSKGL